MKQNDCTELCMPCYIWPSDFFPKAAPPQQNRLVYRSTICPSSFPCLDTLSLQKMQSIEPLKCHEIGNRKNCIFVSICPILPSYPFNSHSTQQQQYSQPACKPQPVAFRKQTWQQQLGSNWIRLPVWPVLLGLKVLNTTHLATCDRSWQSQSSCRYWQPSRHPARVCRKCPGHSSSFAKGLLGKSDRSSTRREQITFEQF